jgi:hypothetical protein
VGHHHRLVLKQAKLCNELVGHFARALADEIKGRGNTILAKPAPLAVFSGMGLAMASIVVPALRAHDRMSSFVAAHQEARRQRSVP